MIFFPFGPVFACKLFTFAWNISTFSDVKANRKNIETTTLNSKCFVGELRWLLNCPTTYFVVNSHFVCNDSTECVACFTLIQRFIISVVDLRAAFFGHFFLLSLFFSDSILHQIQTTESHAQKITWDHILLITRKYTNRLIIIVGLSCSQFNNSPLIWKK